MVSNNKWIVVLLALVAVLGTTSCMELFRRHGGQGMHTSLINNLSTDSPPAISATRHPSDISEALVERSDGPLGANSDESVAAGVKCGDSNMAQIITEALQKYTQPLAISNYIYQEVSACHSRGNRVWYGCAVFS